MKRILLSFYLLTSFSMTYAASDTNIIEVFKKSTRKTDLPTSIFIERDDSSSSNPCDTKTIFKWNIRLSFCDLSRQEENSIFALI